MKVWLPRSIRDEFIAEADAWFPFESGGLLVGYVEREEHVITHMIGPGPLAHHQRKKFHGDHAWQCQMLEELYVRTAGVARFLGDWHTHPWGSNLPSFTDLRTLRRIRQYGPAAATNPVMLIWGGSPGDWQPMAHVHQATIWGLYSRVESMYPQWYR